jgi:prevent-host-death family protein
MCCGSVWSQMTEQIGIRELRDRLTATMRRVRDGETIEITHHGQPVALLTPVRGDRIDRLLEAADVTGGEPPAHPIRRFAATGGLSASEALEDDRAER